MSNFVQGSWKDDGPIGYNEKGGIMTQIKNDTGAASIKGTLITFSDDNAGDLTPIDAPSTDCVVWEDGVDDGDWMWVVFSGPAQVAYVGATTAGHMARSCLAADGGAAAGYAIDDTYPAASPFNDDTSALKIGGILETITGAGLAWTMLKL